MEEHSQTWRRDDGFEISTDPARVDFDLIHRFLRDDSYWATGLPADVLERAIAGSVVFGIYTASGEQAGFARVVTDKATFGWICDVFVLPDYRGLGLGRWLMECITTHPDLQGFRRWLLGTRDAHGLYAKFGFEPLPDPTRFMQRRDRDVYNR